MPVGTVREEPAEAVVKATERLLRPGARSQELQRRLDPETQRRLSGKQTKVVASQRMVEASRLRQPIRVPLNHAPGLSSQVLRAPRTLGLGVHGERVGRRVLPGLESRHGSSLHVEHAEVGERPPVEVLTKSKAGVMCLCKRGRGLGQDFRLFIHSPCNSLNLDSLLRDVCV